MIERDQSQEMTNDRLHDLVKDQSQKITHDRPHDLVIDQGLRMMHDILNRMTWKYQEDLDQDQEMINQNLVIDRDQEMMNNR